MIKRTWISPNEHTLYLNFGIKKIKFGLIGLNSRLSPYDSIFGHSNNIYIENNVFIGRETYMDAVSEIRIGSGTMIGPRCIFIGSTHNYDSLDLKAVPYDNTIHDRKIVVERNVWIAAGVMICPGTHIGEGAVIGAGACVYGEIPPFAVVVSNGYRIIKERNKDKYNELVEKEAIYNKLFVGSSFEIRND